MRFRRHLELRVVKDGGDSEPLKFPTLTPDSRVFETVEKAAGVALSFYALKRAIDFAAHAAEHIVVTKIR